MKKLKSSIFAKFVAVILLVVLALTCAGTAVGAVLMGDLGYFSQGRDAAEYNLIRDCCRKAVRNEVYGYGYDDARDNIFIELKNADGLVIFSEEAPEKLRCTVYFNVRYLYFRDMDGSRYLAGVNISEHELEQRYLTDESEYEEYEDYTAVCFIPEKLSVKDELYRSLQLFNAGCRLDAGLIWIPIVCFLLGVAVFVFLMCAAGHRGDEIRGGISERIPFDVFTVLLIGLAGIIIAAADELGMSGRIMWVIVGLAGIAIGLILLWWCMSLAVRVKLGTLVKSCWTYKVCVWCLRVIKKLWGWLCMIVRGIPAVWRSGAILGGIFLLGIIVAVGVGCEEMFFFWIFLCMVLIPLALYAVIMLDRLRRGAKRLSDGELDSKVDTKYMRGPILESANYLNGIGNGISKAVEEKMKSERMKAELITNVSHDIKTPLTSIVNYVDLLSREKIEGEKANEYIDVLKRQSARLKKLTEDLVEASKASTGNLSVDAQRLDLSMMLEQAAGEYGERLSSASLELIMRKGAEGVCVLADPRHTRRIFDNLMSNIVKYAMPGTRVYLDIADGGDTASVFFRNTSRAVLNVGADELTERFVRGDASRSTEGSGLGLSIAKSLAELQGGELLLTVDGDLFKAELKMKKA